MAADLGGQGARFTRSFRPDLVNLHETSKEVLGAGHRKPLIRNDENSFKLPNIEGITLVSRDGTALSARSGREEPGSKSTDKMPNTAR